MLRLDAYCAKPDLDSKQLRVLLRQSTALHSMDIFTELFEHQRELRVIICRPCAIAIPPAQIVSHLKARYLKVLVSLRKDVAAIAHTLPDLAWDPRNVRILKPAEDCIALLQHLSNGFVCTFAACGYTCTTLR
jgi:hypothetical protein